MRPHLPDIPPDATPQQILQAGIEAAGGPVSLACSFSLEDVAIIDIAHQAGLALGVFAIDTGRLNEETYEVADALVERYRLKIDWYFPRHEDVEKLERAEGCSRSVNHWTSATPAAPSARWNRSPGHSRGWPAG